MNKKKISIIAFIVLSLILMGTVIYASDNIEFQFFKQIKGIPLDDHKVIIKADGKKILTTTSGDYYDNKVYYNKKYGLGKFYRTNHTPIEPKDIQYKPHPTAIERGYPIIHINSTK